MAGDLDPTARWLDGAVVDTEAFAATTLDVPLGDLAGLADLVDQLVRETETLPPGRARARVADEWVSEVTVDSLDDETPYTEIVRVVGERLLESDAPALLWHAARQLSLVAGGDRRVAERVVERCLPLARLEDGRSPASAAAPFLTVLPAERAARLLERIAPHLDDEGWDAVARVFLAGAFRTRWQDWRPHAMRWANGSDAGLARAATSALGHGRPGRLMRYGYKASAEQFGPRELLELVAAGRAPRLRDRRRLRPLPALAPPRRPRARRARRGSAPPAGDRARSCSARACSRRRCATTRRSSRRRSRRSAASPRAASSSASAPARR